MRKVIKLLFDSALLISSVLVSFSGVNSESTDGNSSNNNYVISFEKISKYII